MPGEYSTDGVANDITWLDRSVYHADNVADGITNLPRWLRLLVPVAGAAVAGLIARFRNAPSQNVSNVMEAAALEPPYLASVGGSNRRATSHEQPAASSNSIQ